MLEKIVDDVSPKSLEEFKTCVAEAMDARKAAVFSEIESILASIDPNKLPGEEDDEEPRPEAAGGSRRALADPTANLAKSDTADDVASSPPLYPPVAS